MNTSKKPDIDILHITAEYPNAYRSTNTMAIYNLIKGLPDLKHCVVAIKRTDNPFKTAHTIEYQQVDNQSVPLISVRYWAPSYGVLSRLSLFLAARYIQQIIKSQQIEFSCIHAHKLTTEGIIAHYLSKSSKKPFMVSIRGESESKFYRFKPYIIPYLNKILTEAKHIFYVSAWFKKEVLKHSKIAESKQSNLPNFVKRLPAPSDNKRNAIVAVADINVYKKKGLDNLIKAFTPIAQNRSETVLEIYGNGSHKNINKLQKIINQQQLNGRVILMGPLENQKLIERISTSLGLALPSFNETFGMVYVEALLSGVPVLYSFETGIDGFLNPVEAKVGVNPKSIEDISRGLDELIDHSDEYRNWLKQNHQLVHKLFDKRLYLEHYRKVVHDITKQ